MDKQVSVNGMPVALPASGRLMDLLQALNLDGRYVFVEHNGEAVLKDQIPSLELSPGDRLEIVKPVAGG